MNERDFIELVKGLQSTATLVQTLISEIKDNSVSLASLKTELKGLHDNLDELSKIILSGNGKSIVTRVALLEENLKNLQSWMDDIVEGIEKYKDQETEKKDKIKRERGKLKWSLFIVIVGGFLGIVGSLLIQYQSK